jgi:transposase
METYSMDLRERVLAACDAGKRTRIVAQQFGVSPAWVRRLKQRRRETGEVAARKRGRRDAGMFDRMRLVALRRMVRQSPDVTLAQLQMQVDEELGIQCSLFTVWRTLRRAKITLKKSPSGRSSTNVRT